MKFGWMTLSLSPSPDDDLASIDQQLEQGVLAEAVGFDHLWLTEHNVTGECAYADPIPFAGALAARTSRARIGFAVIQMALHHPVRVAIQTALLDNVSHGRLDVGIGRGPRTTSTSTSVSACGATTAASGWTKPSRC